MSLNYVLIWMVGISCAAGFWRVARMSTKLYRDWLVVFAGVLGLLGTGLVFFFNQAGYVAGIAWLLFVLSPSLGTRLVWRWSLQQRYAAAWRLACVLRWLHPFGTERYRAELARATWLAQTGRIDQATQCLERLVARGGPAGRAATAQLFQLPGQWRELLEWVRDSISETSIAQEAGLLTLYLRALGETGNLERMLWVYAQFGGALERAGHRPSQELCRLLVLAFCGQQEAVNRLLENSVPWLTENSREFWRATAEQAAGYMEKARERFRQLLDCETDSISRAAIEQRLRAPVSLAAFSESGWSLLHEVVADSERTTSTGENSWSRFGLRQAHVTHLLAGLNIGMFAIEIINGGSETESVLYKMGALVPELVTRGEWWRLLSSTFLHYGATHLTMNMAGLLVLGPFVEASLGRWRYATTYLTSGLISMWAVVLLARGGWIEDGLLVGASGSIMGLVGATAWVLLRHWHKERSRPALQRLQRVLFAIGLQVLFDAVTPQVSMSAHMSGVFAGALVAWVLTRGIKAAETSG